MLVPLNYNPCQVQITKYHLSGSLEGMTTTEKMSFTDWERACEWAAGVTENVKCCYVVLDMTDLDTGNKEYF